MNLDKLIGKTFRRNRYGLSIWQDVITEISIRYKLHFAPDRSPKSQKEWWDFVNSSHYMTWPRTFEIIIKGNGQWYSLNEIVIYP